MNGHLGYTTNDSSDINSNPVRPLVYDGSCRFCIPFTVLQPYRSKRHPANIQWAALVIKLGGSIGLYTQLGEANRAHRRPRWTLDAYFREASIGWHSPQSIEHGTIAITARRCFVYGCTLPAGLLCDSCCVCHTSHIANQSRRVSSEPFPSATCIFSLPRSIFGGVRQRGVRILCRPSWLLVIYPGSVSRWDQASVGVKREHWWSA